MNAADIIAQLPRHPTKVYGTRDLADIDGISIHHSADEGSPWSWAEYQIKPAAQGGPVWVPGGDGAPGICYHYVILRDGRVFKCQPDSAQAWHTAGHNRHLFGVVFQGNLAVKPPTERQIQSGLWLIRSRLFSYDLVARHPENIRGHGEWDGNPTTCPGTWLAAMFRAVLNTKGA